VKFFTASGKGGPVNELRKQFELPIVMEKHQHEVESKGQLDEWFCDGCNTNARDLPKSCDMERFRCKEGCDFDYCCHCLAKCMEPIEESFKTPTMVIFSY